MIELIKENCIKICIPEEFYKLCLFKVLITLGIKHRESFHLRFVPILCNYVGHRGIVQFFKV